MKTTNRLVYGIFICASLLFASAVNASDKPNIVLVFLDNFGWGEPGFNGGGIIRGAATPALDRLAGRVGSGGPLPDRLAVP